MNELPNYPGINYTTFKIELNAEWFDPEYYDSIISNHWIYVLGPKGVVLPDKVYEELFCSKPKPEDEDYNFPHLIKFYRSMPWEDVIKMSESLVENKIITEKQKERILKEVQNENN